MPKVSLSKTIEATKLNKRTGFAESGPEATIPFGGLVEHVATERNVVRFTYMGDPYRCAEDVWVAATRDAAAPAIQSNPQQPNPVRAVAAVVWEQLDSPRIPLSRTRVPGGWLLATTGGGIAFYPDPAHEWDGKSLEV